MSAWTICLLTRWLVVFPANTDNCPDLTPPSRGDMADDAEEDAREVRTDETKRVLGFVY